MESVRRRETGRGDKEKEDLAPKRDSGSLYQYHPLTLAVKGKCGLPCPEGLDLFQPTQLPSGRGLKGNTYAFQLTTMQAIGQHNSIQTSLNLTRDQQTRALRPIPASCLVSCDPQAKNSFTFVNDWGGESQKKNNIFT